MDAHGRRVQKWPVGERLPVGLVLAIAAGVVMVVVYFGSSSAQVSETPQTGATATASQAESSEESRFAEFRRRMVRNQFRARDITDPRVLDAMGRVGRHHFVPEAYREFAYDDRPLPIGHGQTISQPYIVALMTQLVRPKPGGRALDIGTGSGYQAAVLGRLYKEVYSIEIVEPLAKAARKRLATLGYKNVTVRHGDGYRGWPEHAPFDAIVVAAAAGHVPEPLTDQLAPGGRLVMPVGNFFQDLILIEKLPDGSLQRRNIGGVAFVPMTGEAQDR